MKLLSSPELAERWGEIKPHIDKALVHGSGEVTSYGLFIQCLGATAQCWEVDTGFCITSLENIEGIKRIAIVAASSSDWFSEGPQVLEQLEEFGRTQGCTKSVVYGRKGWVRTLKQYGYGEKYVTLFKEL